MLGIRRWRATTWATIPAARAMPMVSPGLSRSASMTGAREEWEG